MNEVDTDGVFPAPLIEKHFLAEIPESTFRQSNPAAAKAVAKTNKFIRLFQKKQQYNRTQRAKPAHPVCVEFNAAAWLRFDTKPEKPVSLLLVFEDSRGEFAVIADESVVSEERQVMLSGTVCFESIGELKRMSVHCAGTDHTTKIIVDELHVQKIGKANENDKQELNEVQRYLTG